MGEKTVLTVETFSAEETEATGRRLGSFIEENRISDCFIALYGDLGAGKTAFVRGLASVISPEGHVCSPTYTIVNEYGSGKKKLYHFDMYRIADEDDLFSIGFYDYRGILAVEWCENIPYAIPENRIEVRIEKTGEGSRHIAVTEVSESK